MNMLYKCEKCGKKTKCTLNRVVFERVSLPDVDVCNACEFKIWKYALAKPKMRK